MSSASVKPASQQHMNKLKSCFAGRYQSSAYRMGRRSILHPSIPVQVREYSRVTNPRPELIDGRRYLRNTTTQRTPWTNHNQVCTTMNREPALLPCTSYHTRIMHGEGVGTADSTTTTLDTKANNNNSYPSKDPEYYTQRSLTHQYITQRKPTYAVLHSKKQKD